MPNVELYDRAVKIVPNYWLTRYRDRVSLFQIKIEDINKPCSLVGIIPKGIYEHFFDNPLLCLKFINRKIFAQIPIKIEETTKDEVKFTTFNSINSFYFKRFLRSLNYQRFEHGHPQYQAKHFRKKKII